MTSEQLRRLCDAIHDAATAGNSALVTFGWATQEQKAVEEMGELLTAIARCKGGRDTSEHVVEEAADVIITALQIGMMYGEGLETLIEKLTQKAHRLNGRIAEERTRRTVPKEVRDLP